MSKKINESDGNHPPAFGQPGEVETWDITKLHQNPRQDANFHPLPEREMDRLAKSIRLNGQRDAIEVLPDGTIVDGHQRVRAARQLGLATVRVVVRHDLAGDDAAIERRMIEANLERRQLDILDEVRLARRQEEIKKGRKPGGLSQYAEQDLRDRIGVALGKSGRHVQRYLNVLKAPMEVQRAVAEKRLTMGLAEKVARLGQGHRDEIAAEIAAGGDPAAVVAAHLPAAAPAVIDPDREYAAFFKVMAHAVEVLAGREGQVRGGDDLESEIGMLKQCKELNDRLIARYEELKGLRAETLRNFGLSGF